MLILKTKKYVITFTFLIIVLFAITECKRGGGRRGGTYRGSSNVWGRAKQSQNGQTNPDMYGQRRAKSQSSAPVQDPNKKAGTSSDKASAPPAPKTDDKSASSSFIHQEKKQQSAPLGTSNTQQQQRPIGWDVGKNGNPDTNINKNVAHQQHASPSQTYPNSYGTGNNNNYGQPPPPYTPNQHMSGTGNYGQAPPPYSPSQNYHYGQAPPPYTPNQQYNYGQAPAYTPNQHNNYGPPPPPYSPHQSYSGQYPNSNLANPYGYGHSPAYGGPQTGSGGILGSIFGGNKYGKHSGFGGVGGYGGYGMGGYGKRYGGGFGSGFGKHAFRNVMIGMLVWNLVSGFTRRPYYVYNYYNNPEKIPEEIPLPMNAIVVCPENVTSLCAPNTAALCTSNNTIMCVVLAQDTVSCGENTTMKCVNSTVTCSEDNTEDGCENNEKDKNVTTSVNIPCVTNATLVGKLTDDTTIAFSGTGSMTKGNAGDTVTFCVTTLALPQPEEEANQGVKPLCSTENASSTTCVNNPTGVVNSTALIKEDSASPLVDNSSTPPLAM